MSEAGSIDVQVTPPFLRRLKDLAKLKTVTSRPEKVVDTASSIKLFHPN
jgi:hypothetical protein